MNFANEFPEEFSEMLKVYFQNPDFFSILGKLGIQNDNITEQEIIEKVKEYILETMFGKFHLQSSIKRFLIGIENYLQNPNKFKRNEDGEVDYNVLLPIKEEIEKRGGLRGSNNMLGQNNNEYICKEAEGLKSGSSGRKNWKYGKYNPIVAQAVFEYLGEESAEFLLALEKLPYYHILSKNFLRNNQSIVTIEKMGDIQKDENNNYSHQQILQRIKQFVDEQIGENPKSEKIYKKISLQYAIQETIKNFICSMDENLGNTGVILTKTENGETEDISLSPAYDMDLSFSLGEEILNGDYTNQILYRTGENGKSDLFSIMQTFESIPGYKEKLAEIMKKLNGNYVENIFKIAYSNSEIEQLKNNGLRDSYGNFLMRRVAEMKEAYKLITSKSEIQKSKNE